MKATDVVFSIIASLTNRVNRIGAETNRFGLVIALHGRYRKRESLISEERMHLHVLCAHT